MREITTLVKWIRSFIFQRLELVNYGQKNSDCFQGLIFSLQTPTFSLPNKQLSYVYSCNYIWVKVIIYLYGYFFIHVWKEKYDCMFSNFRIQPIINDFLTKLLVYWLHYDGFMYLKKILNGNWWKMKIVFKIWFHNYHSVFF